MAKKIPQAEVLIEVLIQINGSSRQNRLTSFRMPILNQAVGNTETDGIVEFDTKDLIRRAKDALDRLV